MPRFEVFVPASPPKLPIDLTLRIDAEHWLAALKAGMQKIGDAQMSNNVLCDIQADGSIHVTDPDAGRVFRIAELPQPAATAPPAPPPVAPAAVSAPAARPPPPPSAQPAPPPPVARAPAAPPPAAARPAAAAPVAPPTAAPPPPERPITAPTPIRTTKPSGLADRVEVTRQPASKPDKPIGRITQVIKAEEVLADLFLEVADLTQITKRKEGLEFVLDLAMRTIGCEAGSVLLSDLSALHLTFEVARGPTAEKLLSLGLRVPMGVGVVGFCAQENVCLAVSDAQKDPRFYRAVSEAVGYQTQSLLCSPVAYQGSVLGALEVLNKQGGQPFGPKDLAVLAYLATQTALFLERLNPNPYRQ